MRPRVSPLRAVQRLLGREPLPEGFTGVLDADERVLAAADGPLVVTNAGLWLPGEEARTGWHRVSKATWGNGVLEVVVADEERIADGVVLLTDRPARRLKLAAPGRVPEAVHQRVTGSIRSRHHRDLPGGGAWFVQRRVPGVDGTVLQVRPDPGADRDAVRRLAGEVARTLGRT